MNNSFQKLLTVIEKFLPCFAAVFQGIRCGGGEFRVAFLRTQAGERVVAGDPLAAHQTGNAGFLWRGHGDGGIAQLRQPAFKQRNGIDSGKRLVSSVQPPPHLGDDAGMGDRVETSKTVRVAEYQPSQDAAL